MNNRTFTLITGATKGIGYELTKLFARHLHSLVLVARDEQKLAEISKQCMEKYSIEVIPLAMDLSVPENVDQLIDYIQQKGISIDILINNAGFGVYGDFLELDEKTDIEMINLNITALVKLTKAIGRIMKDQGHGKILQVASTAAFQPGPNMAVYYATKAFVLSFSEAVSKEFADYHIQVSTLCPGPTETAFHDRAGTRSSVLMQKLNMSAEKCAHIAFEGFMNGKRLIIPGMMNKIGVFLVRFFPRSWVLSVVKLFMKQKKAGN
ncbi:MAG: SDR family oxidoreductase [Calditrichia bacterium]